MANDNNKKQQNDDEFEEFRARAYSGGLQTLTKPKYRKFRDSEDLMDDWSGDEHDTTRRKLLSMDYYYLDSEIWRQSSNGKFATTSTIARRSNDETRRRTRSKEDSFWGFLECEMRPRVNSAPTKRPDTLLNQSRDSSVAWQKPIQLFQRSHQELHRNNDSRSQEIYSETQIQNNINKTTKDGRHTNPCSHWSMNLIDIPLVGVYSRDPQHDWFNKSCGLLIDRRRIALIGRKGVGKSTIGECFSEDHRIMRNLEIMNTTNQWGEQTSLDEDVSCCSLRHKVTATPIQVQRYQPIMAAKFTAGGVEESMKNLPPADVYLLIYSVENRSSYQMAVDRLFEMKHSNEEALVENNSTLKPIILVANKVDLVRTRVVHEKEGRSTAETYGVDEYLEISAAMGHEIDTLIRSTLKILESRLDPPTEVNMSIDAKGPPSQLVGSHPIIEHFVSPNKQF